MARAKRTTVEPGRDLRSVLAARFAAKADRTRDRVVFPDGTMMTSPWARLVTALDAGRSVECSIHDLPAWARAGLPARVRRCRVDGDGGVTVLR